MKWKLFCCCVLMFLEWGVCHSQATESAPSKEKKPAVSPPQARDRLIEVCFVLDTTGSMGGLIEGAKQKIWSIAGEILEANPGAKVRMGLIGYRDRGDSYVTRTFALSDDIDSLYSDLLKYRAEGGGDTPESVNQALGEAVQLMKWSDKHDALKMIFLVGDAPPHMDYKDDVKYTVSCKRASEKGILINTIQCGDMAETVQFWQAIARSSDGQYVSLGQSGDMVVTKTPMDEKLMELNLQAGKTLVPYGDQRVKDSVWSKQTAAESAPASSVADRLGFNVRSGKAVQGRGDLLDDIKDGNVKLDELKKEQLPDDWKGLSNSEISAKMKEKQKERELVYKEIQELTVKRDAYLLEEKKKTQASAGVTKDAFDEKVAETIRKQGEKVFGK